MTSSTDSMALTDASLWQKIQATYVVGGWAKKSDGQQWREIWFFKWHPGVNNRDLSAMTHL
jgi:hypothetical protein